MDIPNEVRGALAGENLERILRCVESMTPPDFKMTDGQCMDALSLYSTGCAAGKFKVDSVSWEQLCMRTHAVMAILCAASGRHREEWEEAAEKIER